MRGNVHVRFGGRRREDRQPKGCTAFRRRPNSHPWTAPAASCCSGSSPPPTNAAASRSRPLAVRAMGPVSTRAQHRRQPARPAAAPQQHRRHRRRELPHARSPKPNRRTPLEALTHHARRGLLLATSGDRHLAIDNRAVWSCRGGQPAASVTPPLGHRHARGRQSTVFSPGRGDGAQLDLPRAVRWGCWFSARGALTCITAGPLSDPAGPFSW